MAFTQLLQASYAKKPADTERSHFSRQVIDTLHQEDVRLLSYDGGKRDMIWPPGNLLFPDTPLPNFDGKWTGVASMIQEVLGDKELRG